MNRTMAMGLQACGVDAWLDVVPQLIANVHAASMRVTKLLRELLIRIGRKHPQVWILLIVAVGLRRVRVRVRVRIRIRVGGRR